MTMEVTIRNFKSVGDVEMRLGRATVLIGPAASGKSNILEALALATYFDRAALYGKAEPLRRLLRAESTTELFTFYDASSAVEISITAAGWSRRLRIEKSLIEVDGLPAAEHNLFAEPGRAVLGRFYGFDRFREDVVGAVAGRIGEQSCGAPRDLLRDDGRNMRVVAGRQLEAIRDVNAVLQEFSRVEVRLLGDRIALFDGGVEAKAGSDSVYRALYYLIGLSSTVYFAKVNGLEGRTLVLLEEPETHPQFLGLIVKYIAKLSEVGYAVISTHSPLLVSLLRDKVDVTLYYVYRGEGGLTEVAELDKDKLAQELVTSLDLLLMKPREALRLSA